MSILFKLGFTLLATLTYSLLIKYIYKLFRKKLSKYYFLSILLFFGITLSFCFFYTTYFKRIFSNIFPEELAILLQNLHDRIYNVYDLIVNLRFVSTIEFNKIKNINDFKLILKELRNIISNISFDFENICPFLQQFIAKYFALLFVLSANNMNKTNEIFINIFDQPTTSYKANGFAFYNNLTNYSFCKLSC